MSAHAEIEGVDWNGDDGALIRLEDGRVSGSGGVNRIMGEYRLAGESLSFGAIATTMMAGPPERTESEQRFLAAVARVAAWSVDGDQLVLCDEAALELIRLRPATTTKESTMELIYT